MAKSNLQLPLQLHCLSKCRFGRNSDAVRADIEWVQCICRSRQIYSFTGISVFSLCIPKVLLGYGDSIWGIGFNRNSGLAGYLGGSRYIWQDKLHCLSKCRFHWRFSGFNVHLAGHRINFKACMKSIYIQYPYRSQTSLSQVCNICWRSLSLDFRDFNSEVITLSCDNLHSLALM